MQLSWPLLFLVFSHAPPAIAQSALHKGENLLQPMPIPGENWKVASGSKDETEIMQWSNADTMEKYTVRVIHDGGDYLPSRFRQINEGVGKEKCSPFSSQGLDAEPVNGYKRAIWLAECGKTSGTLTTILNQYISGRDSSYYITKAWLEPPKSDSIDSWISYFKTINLCDTRKRRKAPCPNISPADGN